MQQHDIERIVLKRERPGVAQSDLDRTFQLLGPPVRRRFVLTKSRQIIVAPRGMFGRSSPVLQPTTRIRSSGCNPNTSIARCRPPSKGFAPQSYTGAYSRKPRRQSTTSVIGRRPRGSHELIPAANWTHPPAARPANRRQSGAGRSVRHATPGRNKLVGGRSIRSKRRNAPINAGSVYARRRSRDMYRLNSSVPAGLSPVDPGKAKSFPTATCPTVSTVGAIWSKNRGAKSSSAVDELHIERSSITIQYFQCRRPDHPLQSDRPAAFTSVRWVL